MLRTSGLEVVAGKRHLIGPINLTCPFTEICALIGPNGAGKSTLLRALSGDQQGRRGKITIDSPLPTPRVAYLPQTTSIAFGYTVAELLTLANPTPEAYERAIDAMELTPLLKHPLTQLSGGERQRAFIGRAFCQETPILLLDEPFTALDPRFRLRLEAALKASASRGALIIAALHDLAQARRLADHLLLLHQGKVIAEGTADNVLTAHWLAEVYGISPDHLTLT